MKGNTSILLVTALKAELQRCRLTFKCTSPSSCISVKDYSDRRLCCTNILKPLQEDTFSLIIFIEKPLFYNASGTFMQQSRDRTKVFLIDGSKMLPLPPPDRKSKILLFFRRLGNVSNPFILTPDIKSARVR